MIKRFVMGLVMVIGVGQQALYANEKDEIAQVKKIVAKVLPNVTPEIISPSAVTGLYEVIYGAQVLYVSADARYVIQGDVIDVENRANLTEATRANQRKNLIANLDESTMIVFEPEEVKHTLTVFTDIDCGYCRKLHKEIDQYLAEGIRIRYLAFPRAGVNSKSYQKTVSVWCANNQQASMTKAKSGAEPSTRDCKNPVKEHMAIADIFAVTGTPTLVLENGDVIPGYVPAKRLSQMMNKTTSKATM